MIWDERLNDLMGRMINMKKYLLIAPITLTLLFAQSSAIFLLIPPSPTMNGLGREIGVCLPYDDPYAGYYNPANGLQLFEGNAYHYSKLKTRWLPRLADDMYLHYEVMNVGLIPKKYPVKAVISSHKTYLDLGEQIMMGETYSGTFRSYMKADALTFGVGFSANVFGRIPIDFAFGITRKEAIQELLINPDTTSLKSSNIFYDYGTLISIPISSKYYSFIKNEEFKDDFELQIIPSFGYSISNVGDGVKFDVLSSESDPSPRYLRTGIASSVTLSYKSLWSIIEWKGGRSASDLLVKPRYNNDDPIEYQSGFDNDIDFIRNVVLSKPDSSIQIYRGDEWTLFEIYSFRFGRENDITGKVNITSAGYGYNSTGLFKLLYFMLDEPMFKKLSEYIVIKYDHSILDEGGWHPLSNTKFESFSVTFNNIDRLILGLLK